jgi:hypothetical protein
MALGHDWTPIVRVTPPAGAVYTVSLQGLTWMTVGQPSWEPLHQIKEMLTRAIRKVKYGFRLSIHQEFEFFTPSADETTLAQLVISPACDPDNDYGFEISLDNGATYRVAELVDVSRSPIEKKNIGVHVTLDWTCSDAVPTLPAIGTGAWS